MPIINTTELMVLLVFCLAQTYFIQTKRIGCRIQHDNALSSVLFVMRVCAHSLCYRLFSEFRFYRRHLAARSDMAETFHQFVLDHMNMWDDCRRRNSLRYCLYAKPGEVRQHINKLI